MLINSVDKFIDLFPKRSQRLPVYIKKGGSKMNYFIGN